MNQEKIGRFIAESRKAKNYTQEELAEKLGITNKAISKWENGICLPDSSLYQPLCQVLDISISELFAGERCKEEKDSEVNEYLIDLLVSRLYDSNCGISYEEFRNYLFRISEVTVFLSKFETKEDAIHYLMQETNCSFEECSTALDFYRSLSKKNKG